MPEFRVVFVARDYEATTEFFIDVMRLEVLRSFEEGGKGMILSAAGGQIEVFAPGDDPPDLVSGATLAWEVADADVEHDRLIAAGAEILRPPQVQPWGHKSFVVEGPDGWVMTLFEIVVPQ